MRMYTPTRLRIFMNHLVLKVKIKSIARLHFLDLRPRRHDLQRRRRPEIGLFDSQRKSENLLDAKPVGEVTISFSQKISFFRYHDREDIVIYKDQGFMAPTFNRYTIGVIGKGSWVGIKDLLT